LYWGRDKEGGEEVFTRVANWRPSKQTISIRGRRREEGLHLLFMRYIIIYILLPFDVMVSVMTEEELKRLREEVFEEYKEIILALA